MPFEKVAKAKDIRPGRTYGIYKGYATVGLANVEGSLYAFDGWCSHGGNLIEGTTVLDGHDVVCPQHWGSFDVRTGKASAFPCRIPIDTFPVRIIGEDIEIDFPEGYPPRASHDEYEETIPS